MNDIAKKKFESLFPDGEMEPQEFVKLCHSYTFSMVSTHLNALWNIIEEMPLPESAKNERYR